ncbi:Uncharacterised protein [Mycobacterium tuberculosis]|uniref:Uncharacterized protein n=1 Tax=Mycobacterium tuberculosis TaxID=1773 RepID=A0A655F5K7_MYCTX|nr:Uncharacterised protein [Mycobacterium tuberculosis]CFE75105.1 Uncharacterised protein [Mycobacterium tuberculosis]CFS06737.1 Uncharacterised protein [Mycobacterium tuberculosis]CKO41012.1 Uncharacterised protein [Mycobacterium tuberculosis]CKR56707.1 Uncharacterised protein [Mycobacterium tuberculosis]
MGRIGMGWMVIGPMSPLSTRPMGIAGIDEPAETPNRPW